ncbi:MAG: ABC transporter ATP-binding protein [Methanobacteriota archaeon]|nr:MAG: ABC transporter ATP-binding protein [Euryarchaeota archaeon]
MAVIEADRVTKRFDKITALYDVSLAVDNGNFFGLFGPNGAGKTTLVKILTGQLLPSSGKALVDGVDVIKNPMEVKRRIGIVPEVESPPSYLTSHEYLYFVCRVRNVKNIESKIEHWLKFFEMEDAESKICRDLSKGARQKLMLASAFIHEPDIFFLDEPFINLDPIYQKKAKDYMVECAGKGKTIFMCSHLLDIAEKLCDRVAIINGGMIIKSGSLDEVRGEEKDLESAFLKIMTDRRK